MGMGGRCDCEMMAPLRDGDPLVFMNEPSVGWSVMALRTLSWLPPPPPLLTTADTETHVNIQTICTNNDASVTHKARFFCGKCHG